MPPHTHLLHPHSLRVLHANGVLQGRDGRLMEWHLWLARALFQDLEQRHRVPLNQPQSPPKRIIQIEPSIKHSPPIIMAHIDNRSFEKEIWTNGSAELRAAATLLSDRDDGLEP